MKTLTKLALAAVMLTAAVSVKAEWVNGYFRSNGIYVAPYYRTPANGTPCDNLSYRGYLSQQPGYISPRSYPSSYSIYGSSTQIGGTTFHSYYSSNGDSLSGTTLTIGNTSFTSLYGW